MACRPSWSAFREHRSLPELACIGTVDLVSYSAVSTAVETTGAIGVPAVTADAPKGERFEWGGPPPPPYYFGPTGVGRQPGRSWRSR